MELKRARQIAKESGRTLKVRTIRYEDLARTSIRFFSITPSFRRLFSEEEDRQSYLETLCASEIELMMTCKLNNNGETILKD